MQRCVLASLALVTLVGCSSQAAATPKAAPTTSSPTVTADPYDVYAAHVTAAGIGAPEVQRDEAVKVAGNTCDNTVDDMAGLLNNLRSLYPTDAAYRDMVTDRAYFIDAYCPSARVVYNAATQQVIGQVIPAAH
jgi:hypothetical protein